MKISISNLAWDVSSDSQVAELLKHFNVFAIDVVPGKYVTNVGAPRQAEADAARHWWSKHGVQIVGMQALLFGTQGLNLFGAPESQNAMLAHLEQVARIAHWLGAKWLVFGSPRNRDCSGLSTEATFAKAKEFFLRLGEIALRNRVVFCLEPNPVAYGCNFLTNTMDAAEFVRALDHDGIRLQLDTGAIAMNGEEPAATVRAVQDVIGHVHVSEPNLAEIGSLESAHSVIAEALAGIGYNKWATIEMKAGAEGRGDLDAIARALAYVTRTYDV